MLPMLTRSMVWLCVATFLTATSASGQFVQHGPRLETLSELEDWFFGFRVSMSADGNTVAASVFYRVAEGPITGAYVWSRQGAGWRAPTVLLTPSSRGGTGSVAISGDGNTIIVGNDFAAWVWRRSGGTWIQDGSELVATGVDTGAGIGQSVALSHDGTTAIIGASGGNAAWIWSRQAGVWTQTARLLPDNGLGATTHGSTVSLSADGNTALVGLAADNNETGAAWIWERTSGGWRQGPKLVASTAIGAGNQGEAVALSGDGRTAIVGGSDDDGQRGAAWIWSRTDSGWTEVAKLVAPVLARQGQSVSLSGDGRVALVGGFGRAAVLWIKSGNSWPQQGTQLTGSIDREFSFELQGAGVALSADGTIAASTSLGYEGRNGALWIFAAPPTPLRGPDMDGDGIADVAVWQPHTGRWTWQTAAAGFDAARAGSKSWGRGDSGDVPLTGDVDGDGIDDLFVYRSTTGAWSGLTSSSGFSAAFSTVWGGFGDVPMLADMDGDGRVDITVWRPSTGEWFWLKSSSNWRVGDTRRWGAQGDQPLLGDFDGDGRADLTVFRPSTGQWFWLTSGSGYRSGFVRTWGGQGDVPLLADLDGDGKSDIIAWRPSVGDWFWAESSSGYRTQGRVRWGGGNDIPLVSDFDGDRRADVAVFRPSTATWYWLRSTSNNTASKTVVSTIVNPLRR